MTKENLIKYIQEEYGVFPDYPFAESVGDYAVFRHKDNKKWFALLMNVQKNKFHSNSKELVWALNVKCDPLLRTALLEKKGVYVAYHMSKEHWISVVLDEAEAEDVEFVISMSFDLTKAKYKKKKQPV